MSGNRRGGGTPQKRGSSGTGGGQRRGQKGGRAGAPNRRREDSSEDRVQQLAGPLAKVLERLPEAQRRVLELRMGLVDGHPQNLADTARALGLTMHEAKQIEERAFAHIREAIPLDRLQKLLKD